MDNANWVMFFESGGNVPTTCEPATRWGLGFFEVNVPASHLSQVLDNPDALQSAMELGRLDFISGMLAVFGLFLGLSALFSFAYVLGAARSKAKDETKLYLANHLSVVCLPHVEKYLERNLSTMIGMMSELTKPVGEISPDWGSAVDPEKGAGGK